MTNVAINGLGRIGRAALKVILESDDLKLVAINDLVPADNLAYLLRYDTAYGKYHKTVEAKDDKLIIDGQEYPVLNQKNPAEIPWKDFEVELVFECSGVFTNREDLEKHLKAGAKKVILSAPAKSDDIKTIVFGVNSGEEEGDIISCASCTTNCISPVVEILSRRIGIKKANMTTIHAYTSSQSLVDGPHKKARRGRAAGANFVPTSTGAAQATAKALPQMEGIFDGAAIRGPVVVGSIADINMVMEKETTVEEINEIFREEAQTERYKGIMGASEDELVSSDIIGDSRASIVDMSMTQVVGGDLVKVMSWYDNEWGYVNQMVREAKNVLSQVAH
ncbi:type I glyceraldehyde-3-phosphate dehydrogenase [Marivirga sp. S37H4]|uniref:Glyceraldehyde-3-phosphate dehydrogenase n=1 Tax=Marivirga aurantiaca TaxID=2802615 RepID=A0A934WYM1_9BACT|nr:type I glyceraldehyde-3-phosphate dehydrogenase [Marivirga aurantiaca]MBK6265574.1 type I glyceraldehyde-3-phosphate dehydrogenase [Marivirga aurantiaca]